MNAQALTDAAVAAGMDDATTVRAFVARNCGKARLAPGGVVVSGHLRFVELRRPGA